MESSPARSAFRRSRERGVSRGGCKPRRSQLSRVATALGLTVCFVGSAACSSNAQQQGRRDQGSRSLGTGSAYQTASTSNTHKRPPSVVAAGDISPDWLGPQRDTARLVRSLRPTRVLTLGDLQYPSGSLASFRTFYDPTWGRFKARTRPSPGNHEYQTPGAAGYFRYFGDAARPLGRSYYGFNLPGWRLLSLNSNIPLDPGSAQNRWLRADLRRTTQPCVLAYWHFPRFSSGSEHGGDPGVGPLWKSLYAAGADIVLASHEHNYEMFRKQNPKGIADRRGIRQFVVGTGGAGAYPFGRRAPNSRTRITGQDGVLQLNLRPRSYTWRFVNVSGRVLDRGGPVPCN